MGHHGNGTLADQRIGRAMGAVGGPSPRFIARSDFAAAAAGVRSICGLFAGCLAWHRSKAAALRDLSLVDDHVLQDIGLNRSLTGHSRYRITRPGAGRSGVGRRA